MVSGGSSAPDPYHQPTPPKEKVAYGTERDWEKKPKKPITLPPSKPKEPVKVIPLPPLKKLPIGRNCSNLYWYDCNNCGTLYPVQERKRPRHAHSFCSPECRGEWHSHNLSGIKTSEKTKQKISNTKKGVTHEERYRRKQEIDHKREQAGPNNPEWYNEAKDLAEEYRRSGEWKRKTKEILERDNYTCQACGWTRDEVDQMDVHHVKKLADWIYEGNDPSEYPDNLLTTICNPCHGHTEGQEEEHKWPKSYRGESTKPGYPISMK